MTEAPPIPAVIPQRYEDAVPLSALHPHPMNPNQADLGLLTTLIDANGYAVPVLAQEATGLLIDGQHRVEAARQRGMTTVPVVWLDVDDATRDRLLASINESTRRGMNDEAALVSLLSGIAEAQGTLEGTGFTGGDLDDLIARLNGPPAPGLTDPDDVPEPPAQTVTQPGDLYRLGDHLVLCGDATKRDEVKRLMGADRAPMMLTDPPYGVNYHAGKKGEERTGQARGVRIQGDLTQAAIPLSFATALEQALDEDARVYLFGGTANWPMYSALFDHHLRMQPRQIVWVKPMILRPNNYHSAHETVFFGWKGSGGGNQFWYGDRTTSDVWEASRDTEHLHPTQKPVEVCAIPIRNSAPPGGLVYEPFGGSGSTLIAAHMLGRRCRVLEIDPVFTDVICRRWANFTGGKPVRVLPDGTTEPVSFTEETQG